MLTYTALEGKICCALCLYASKDDFFRTARGKNQGTALSFVLPKELTLLDEIEKALAQVLDGGGGISTDSSKTSIFKPYQFRMDQIEGFRYRAEVRDSCFRRSINSRKMTLAEIMR